MSDELRSLPDGGSDDVTPLLRSGEPAINEECEYSSQSLGSTLPSWEETKEGMTCPLAFAFLSCAMGSAFAGGYNIGVLNAPETIIEGFISEVHENRTGEPFSTDVVTSIWGVIVSMLCVGAMVGGILGVSLANHIGRKGAMLLINLVTISACLMMGLSKYAMSYEMLIAGRFVCGFSTGVSTGISPLYLSEIAPIALRGAAGSLTQFFIVLGILVSMICGLPQALGNEELWPILLGFGLIPAFLQLMMLPFCPESPRYLLITKEDTHAAERALVFLRAKEDVSNDLNDILTEIEAFKCQPKVSMRDLCRHRELLRPTIVSCMLQFSQQFSGIGAICFYSTSFFQSANLTLEEASYGTIGVFAVNAVMTFVSVLVMDNAGRRTLQLYGLAGMWASSVLITASMLFREQWPVFSYLIIVFTITFVMVYAIGPGPIPWFMVAEFFAQGSRAAAMSVAVMCNWFACFVTGLVFPWMQKGLGDYVFLPFSVLLAGFWIYTYMKVPETRRRSIVEISGLFAGVDARRPSTRVNREDYFPIPEDDETGYQNEHDGTGAGEQDPASTNSLRNKI